MQKSRFLHALTILALPSGVVAVSARIDARPWPLCYNAAMTTKIEEAARTLSKELPAEVQNRIAQNFLAYAEKWRALKTMIDEGVAELDRGEGIEIPDVDRYLERFSTAHAK